LVDHSVEDIIEKWRVSLQHTIQAATVLVSRLAIVRLRLTVQRARTRVREDHRLGFMYPRGSAGELDVMPIYPFERTVFPKMLPCPFLSRSGKNSGPVKGPGGIDESVGMVETTEKVEGDGDGKKGQKKAGATSNVGADPQNRWGHAAGVPIGNANAAGHGHYPYQPSQLRIQSQRPQASGVDRLAGGTPGSLVSLESHVSIEKLAPEIGEHPFS
jgi:hypothetical protein